MKYKVIIIGSGPAGYTAAIYTSRANLEPLLFEGREPGGQLLTTTDVENYPGFPKGILGPDLIKLWRGQAERFGTKIESQEVTRVDFSSRPFKVWVNDALYEAETIIISTGASAKRLGLESEKKYYGRGVSACATCLPSGANIIANNSPKPINEIKEGDLVLTHDGTFKSVVGIGNRHYRGKLVKIAPRYFHEELTLLTPEHPVLATKLDKGSGNNYWRWNWSDPEWVQAGRLTKKHILLYPIVKETKDVQELRLSDLLGLSIDSSDKAHYNNETAISIRIPNVIPINKDFMRLVGYFLADGSITNRGINFYFGNKDREYIDDVVKILKGIFNYEARIRKEGSVYRVECYAGILRDLFEKLFGKYSYGKSLPHWFIYLPVEKQAELIKGYWRGDGGIKRLGFVLVTNSPRLVAQFKTILLRLGIIPQISKRSKEKLNKTKNIFNGRIIQFMHDRYELELQGQWLTRASEILEMAHPLIKERRRFNAFAWINENYVYLPIFKIEYDDYDGLVHNIAVLNNNTYVTPGVTVHNCDGAFFRNKEVVVVGGGDAAMEEALFLTKFATKVTILVRSETLRASKIMADRARANSKISFVWNVEVQEVLGDETKVTGVALKNNKTGKIEQFKTDGVFVAIGHAPNTKIFAGQLELDALGYIITKTCEDPMKRVSCPLTATNIEGVFACGDVMDPGYRQAVTAAGTGCQAAIDAERYLESLKSY